jgi:hypothetical protein
MAASSLPAGQRRLVGLGAALLLAVSTAAQAQPASTCLVQRVEGSALVSAAGAAERPVATGLALTANDTLRTGSMSRVTLACPNDLKVVLGPQSQILVDGLLASDARSFGMRLLDGIAGFIFKGSGAVRVRTPSAVAAVRSTAWAMRVHEGTSEVFAREGVVTVMAPSGTVRLVPGDGVDVSGTGELKPVVPWRPPRIDRFVELLGPDW